MRKRIWRPVVLSREGRCTGLVCGKGQGQQGLCDIGLKSEGVESSLLGQDQSQMVLCAEAATPRERLDLPPCFLLQFLPGPCLLSTLFHPFASDSTPRPPLCHHHASLMDGLSEHPELSKPLANSQFSHSTGNFCFSSHCPDVPCPL